MALAHHSVSGNKSLLNSSHILISAAQAMCLLWVSLIFFIPESPVHFISRRQYAEAREALEWLRGTNEARLDYTFRS